VRWTLLAHSGLTLAELPRRWTFEPWLIAAMCCAAVLYARGYRVLRQRGAARRPLQQRLLCFVLCLATLVLALLSPLDTWSDGLFSAHMVQHELLMLVAAPLLVLARPLDAYLWSLPPTARVRVAAKARTPALLGVARIVSAPAVALFAHGLTRWLWHIPVLFEACLRNETLHGLQHASFFATALVFWWSIVQGGYGRAGYGVSVLFVFATALHTGALGVLISVARVTWYASYALRTPRWGGEALADQHLAGLVMWIVAGGLFTVLGLALFVAWLGEASRRARRNSVQQLMAADRRALTRSVP
jgi:cytochrome c oxidase assembly factor CtaG